MLWDPTQFNRVLKPKHNFFGLLDPAYRCTVAIRPKPNREQTPTKPWV